MELSDILTRKEQKQILRAHAKAEKLRKKYGFKGMERSFSLDDVFEVEAMLGPDEEEIGEDLQGRDWAYFYQRGDGFFGAEKIGKDGKLKEYYEAILPCNEALTWLRPARHAIQGPDYVPLLERLLAEQPNSLFALTDGMTEVTYDPSYVSINAETNIAEQVYYYAESSGKETLLLTKRSEADGREIIRFNLLTKKIDVVDVETKLKDGRTLFYYIEPSDLTTVRKRLITVWEHGL